MAQEKKTEESAKKTTKQNSAKQTSAKTKKTPSNTKTTKAEKPKDISVLIDIRMFAVPERKEMVEKNQKILSIPDDHIVWDEKHEGVLASAKKAWGIKTDKPYVMVLNDDVELCNDFITYCEKIVNVHPDAVISLFPSQFRRRNQVRNRERTSPYISTNEVFGLAVIMKTDYVKQCLDSWSNDVGDDVNITHWANENGIQIITTLPSIVQHIGDESIQDPTRGVVRTDFFNPDPKDVNWDDNYITAWSNVLLR